MAEVKLYIRRGLTEVAGDEKEQEFLVAERKRLFDDLVNTLKLEVIDPGEMNNLKPPHEVVEVIIALGGARVFTAMVSAFNDWLESKKIGIVEIECRSLDGKVVKVKMESATLKAVETVMRELAPCYSTP